MGLNQEADLLRKIPMFAKLEPSKLKLLAFTSELVTFRQEELLCKVGDRADCAYVIMDGEVEILKETEQGTIVTGTLGKNQLFGELGVLTNSPRNATLRAKSELKAMRISDDMFLKLISENPDVALDVIAQLSEKLVVTHRRYEELREELQRLETS